MCTRFKKTSREEVKVYKKKKRRDRALFLDNGAFVIQRQSHTLRVCVCVREREPKPGPGNRRRNKREEERPVFKQ